MPPNDEEEPFHASGILAVEVATFLELSPLFPVRPLDAVRQNLVLSLVHKAWDVCPQAQEHTDCPAAHEAENEYEP